MQAAQRDYCPAFRLHPIGMGIIACIGHRENAIGIGAQQQIDIDGQFRPFIRGR